MGPKGFSKMNTLRYKFLLALILLFCAISGLVWSPYYPIFQVLWKIGLLPASGSALLDRGIPPEYQGQLQLFVLIGQSNMSGRGQIERLPAWYPTVFEFGNDYRWRIATEPIDSTINQVDQVSMEEERAGFSPALSFARTIQYEAKPDALIGLIPCAKGNTTIEEWQRSLNDETLYGSCLKRINAATHMGQVTGVLIFQGESDALDPQRYAEKLPSANAYATKFSKFVNDLRNDLSQPTLPVVFAKIGRTTTPDIFPNWDIVQSQQEMIQLRCAAMITTDDLLLRDFVHFTTASYKIIGQRFATAYLDLLKQHPDCA